MEALHERGQRQVFPGAGAGPRPHWPPEGQLRGSGRPSVQPGEDPGDPVANSASKSSIRRFVITEKAPTRAFSWLKAIMIIASRTQFHVERPWGQRPFSIVS